MNLPGANNVPSREKSLGNCGKRKGGVWLAWIVRWQAWLSVSSGRGTTSTLSVASIPVPRMTFDM